MSLESLSLYGPTGVWIPYPESLCVLGYAHVHTFLTPGLITPGPIVP